MSTGMSDQGRSGRQGGADVPRELLEYLAEGLVDEPDKVSVEPFDGDDGTVSVLSLREVMAVLLQMTTPHLWLATLRVAVSTPPESWLG